MWKHGINSFFFSYVTIFISTIIPKQSTDYVIKQKETLWDIAKKFFTTVEAIMEVNQKETEQVQTGDMILILKEVS